MDQMKTSANHQLLCDKGIILESGGICQNKINLISGNVTAPLIEIIWTFLEHDTDAMERVLAVFSNLYQAGHEVEMMAVLRILYDVSGLQFPEDVELMTGHPEVRQYFLFSFLLDLEDCIQNFMSSLIY